MGMKPYCRCTRVPPSTFITLRKLDQNGAEIWHRDDKWDVIDMCLSPDGQTIFTCGNKLDKNSGLTIGRIHKWNAAGQQLSWGSNGPQEIVAPDLVTCMACDANQVYVGFSHSQSSLSIAAYSYDGVQNWAVDLQAVTIKIAAGSRLDLWTGETYQLTGNTNQIQRLNQNGGSGTFTLSWNGQSVSVPTNPAFPPFNIPFPLQGNLSGPAPDARYTLTFYIQQLSNIYNADWLAPEGNVICTGNFNNAGTGFIDIEFSGVYSGWQCPLITIDNSGIAGGNLSISQIQPAAPPYHKGYVQMTTGGAVNCFGPVGGMPHPDSDSVGGGGYYAFSATNPNTVLTWGFLVPGLFQLDGTSHLPSSGIFPSGALTNYPFPGVNQGPGVPPRSGISHLGSGGLLCANISPSPLGGVSFPGPGTVYKQATDGTVLWITQETLNNSVFIDSNNKHYAGGGAIQAGNGLPQRTTDCFDSGGNIIWTADHSTRKTTGSVRSVKADDSSVVYTAGNRVKV